MFNFVRSRGMVSIRGFLLFSARCGVSIRARLGRCSFFLIPNCFPFVARSREILSWDHVSLKFIVATLLQILCAWKFQQQENALQFKVRVGMNVSRNSNARQAKRTSL